LELTMPRLRRLAVLLLAMAALGCGSQPAFQGETPSHAAIDAIAPEVSIAEADALRQAGALILDVREPSEWATGVIPDATLISLGELQSRVGELPRDRTVVVVCRSGNRSAQGRDILLGAGFTSVTSMAGGMSDWVAAGYSVGTCC
jgi:rhodanese-related sulfurtransferase